ncbi:MAG: glycosyltransferase [Victivallaceae bacterium]|nr:glycosyltransferase [Victivallaceae bacterium]
MQYYGLAVKRCLKQNPLTYRLGMKWRAYEQARTIEREQAYYEREAEQRGLSRDYTPETVKRQLAARLAGRGIFPKPDPDRKPHIVYASRKTPWDAKNIVPALEKFAEVTPYYLSEQGFSCDEATWLGIRDEMNVHLVNFLEKLHADKPVDIVLTYFSGYRITCAALDRINRLGIITAAVNYDDRLCFRGPVEGGRCAGPVEVCKAYDLNLTQAPESLVKYRVEGGIVWLWPLAANQELYYPRNLPFKYEVSFVGSAHGNRKPFIAYLRKNGINVEAFGKGWPNGFIPDEAVPELFSASRINLNFGDIALTDYQCGKCRDFEIPMTGGLMLTTHNPHLADYFELDREIFTFRNKKDCVDRVRWLLANPELCANARRKARERALREHTWEQRSEALLKVMGLNPGSV